MVQNSFINVIGAGLAGCEAAMQIAARGINVKLYDMKPGKKSQAHSSDRFAELVCSNSLKSTSMENSSGILKKEMELLGSVVLESAFEYQVPAGGALAVDRDKFSLYISNKIEKHPNIEFISGEIKDIPTDAITIIATGPLTSEALAEKIIELTGRDNLYFFDAAAPVVSAESIDYETVFAASRYGKGSADYLNCPMDRIQYTDFYNFITKAETAQLKNFEKSSVFEGCMPVEVMARRGFDTLRFGPMKPVGLSNPKTNKVEFAIVQLRSENRDNSQYNLVGFQTNLKFNEQREMMKYIPGLEGAEIERYGVMHRNTYIKSPGFLNEHMQVISNKNLYFAGQITGVEGYLESSVSGIIAGINASMMLLGKKMINFPQNTITGALASYVSNYKGSNYQPMNANFGILPPLKEMIRNKKARKAAMGARAISDMKEAIVSIW